VAAHKAAMVCVGFRIAGWRIIKVCANSGGTIPGLLGRSKG
jgi:hypothetical protein